MINVTKTYLPPIEEYEQYLKGIWERNQLTNNGPLVKELEKKLIDYLGVKNLFFVSNGTIALQIAIKALDLHGEIITTPFSYVATTSSIIWEGCTPVFVDIDPNTLCIDANLIEDAITEKTVAILPTHVYGFPCDVIQIQKIADKHGLKVIYDAAHTFGVEYLGTSLLNYGDISTISFHATKLFHTTEGGALITDDEQIAQRLSFLRNFGHKSETEFWGLGINGKNSEFHAAMGLCVLPHVQELILKRKKVYEIYNREFSQSKITIPPLNLHSKHNYSYYPVLFSSEEQLLEVKSALNREEIFPRRYFYPSLNKLPYAYQKDMPVSEDISRRILCLPFYHSLTEDELQKIASIINETIGKKEA